MGFSQNDGSASDICLLLGWTQKSFYQHLYISMALTLYIEH